MDQSRKQQDDTQPPGEATQGPAGTHRRKPYRSPELLEYGPVAKLTQGTLSKNSDFFSGGFRMTQMCL